MIAAIADILKAKLNNLPWIERFAGMVGVATRPILTPVDGGGSVVSGYQSYPVACDVNLEDCWEKGKYKILEPDSSKTAVAFFVDNGGAVFRSIDGPKVAFITLSFDLKFVCWMNTLKMGPALTGSRCNVAGRLVPLVMAQFRTCNDAFGKFDGGPEEEAIQEIEITGMSQLPKSPAMFSPFTFATDGDKRGLFLYPYDYFGIRVQGTFKINLRCLQDQFFVPQDEYCIDGSGIISGEEIPDGARITEDGSVRITESGEIRVIE